jgi:hypothetical protein
MNIIKATITFFKYLSLTIMSLALIGAGWYQEVTWYYEVLTGNGMPKEFSLIAGASLSLLLCHFAIKKMAVPFIALLLFSMLFTVVGQNQEYSKKKNTYSVQTAKEESKQDLHSDYSKEIDRLTNSIQAKEQQIPEDWKDQARWKSNGIDPIRNDIAILKKEKKNYEDLKREIVLSESVITMPKTSYDNFAEDIGVASPTLLRYLIMILTALFIGLMAPSGFSLMGSLFGGKKDVVKKPKKEGRADTPPVDQLTIFANSLFRNEEHPSTLKGRPEVTKETVITEYYFNKKSKLAKSLGLIKTNGSVTLSNVSRTEFIMMMRNKTSYRGSLTAVL